MSPHRGPAPVLASERALHRWWRAHALAFVIGGVAAAAAWPALLQALVPLAPMEVPVQPVVEPVLGRGEPALALLKVLVAAPVLENLLLAAALQAVRLLAQHGPARHADAIAVGAASVLFAAAHAPFKPLYGAEVLPLAWLMSLSLLWGLRERRLARGLGLSIGLHAGVNLVAVLIFHGRL